MKEKETMYDAYSYGTRSSKQKGLANMDIMMDNKVKIESKFQNKNQKRYKVQNKFSKKAVAITPQITDDLSTNMFDTNIQVLGSLTDM